MNTVKRVHGGNHCNSCVFARLTDDSDCPLMEKEDLELYFDGFNQLKPIHFIMIKEAFDDCEDNGSCCDDRSHFESIEEVLMSDISEKFDELNLAHNRLLNLVADIRAAAGDPEGKLMQDELVKYIAVLHDRATDGYTAVELLAEAGIK